MSFACMECAVKHSFGERLMKKRIVGLLIWKPMANL